MSTELSRSTFKKDKYESHLECKSLDLRAQNKVLDSKIAITSLD